MFKEAAKRWQHCLERKHRKYQERQIFNVLPLFEEFKLLCDTQGVLGARQQLENQVRKQLNTFHTEHHRHKLTLPDIFELIWDDDKQNFSLVDRDYAVNGNIEERAERGVAYAKQHLNEATARRYQLEKNQIHSLLERFVEQELVSGKSQGKEVLFAENWDNPPSLITLHDGSVVTGWTSDWKCILMPSSLIHGDVGSFTNVYRLVTIQIDGGIQYLVETQGIFHHLEPQQQVRHFVDDSIANNWPDVAELSQEKTEELLMSDAFPLFSVESKSPLSHVMLELLSRIGLSDSSVDEDIRANEQGIESATQVLLSILELELSLPSKGREYRLKVGFEPLAHQLLSHGTLPEGFAQTVLEQYNSFVTTHDRRSFIHGIGMSFPDIFNEVVSITDCGLGTFGGLSTTFAGQMSSRYGVDTVHCPPKMCPICRVRVPEQSHHCPSCGRTKDEVIEYFNSSPSDNDSNYATQKGQENDPSYSPEPFFSVGLQAVLTGRDRLFVGN